MDHLWAPWRMEYVQTPDKEDEKCIFCLDSDQSNDKVNLIIKREEHAFIMMNKYPYNNGHLMVSPFTHTSEFDELSRDVQVEMMDLLTSSMKCLRNAITPDGFNMGANFGTVAGAGIKDHLHFHIVPRWNGDTNFMPVTGNTKVQVSGLMDMYELLAKEIGEQ